MKASAVFVLILLAMLAVAGVSAPAAAQQLDFVIVQPGQPGSTTEAEPVMHLLAEYINGKIDGVSVSGRYFNDLAAAREALAAASGAGRPAWGIVSLPVYLALRQEWDLRPLASTRPGGQDADVWRLVAPEGGPATWQELGGEVQGSMLEPPTPAACLLFNQRPETLPFSLVSTSTPLRAVRNASRGKLAGALLDQPQYAALASVSAGSKVQVILESEPLPTSPVVSFGEPDDNLLKLADLLRQMQADPQAAKLLELLQTQGFGEPDGRLGALEERYARCAGE